MANSRFLIFRNPSINLNISPFSIYVLLDRENIIKDGEILKKIEKRKTVTGNLFTVRAVRKDLVTGGNSRKSLKEALGKANIIAEILNPGSKIPGYLFTHIDYNPENIEKTANQIRLFIKELCERDIKRLKSNFYRNPIPPENNLIRQLYALREYLTKEANKANSLLKIPEKSAKVTQNRPIPSTFRNELPDLFSHVCFSLNLETGAEEPSYYSKEAYYKETENEKFAYSNREVRRAIEELGWDYIMFMKHLERNQINPIINTKDITLGFNSKMTNSRYPGLELEINKDQQVNIKIGTKAGTIFYASILFSMWEGKEFKRSDLTEVIDNVKKRYKEKKTIFFSKEDIENIPNLKWFDEIYKAVLWKDKGSFVEWCIHEYNSTGLSTALTLLKDNIEDALKTEDLSELKNLLLIQKKSQTEGSRKQKYWINLPIDQVKFPDDRWGDLKKAFNKTKQNSSQRESCLE